MALAKINGPKKAAILLLALGEEGAADIIKNLEDNEIQQVGYHMSRLTNITTEELDTVLDEFYSRTALSSGGTISHSSDFVRNALSRALGVERARTLLENLSDSVDASALESLKWLDPKAIANFISHEHPQTIAIILAYMESAEQTSAVLKELPETLQANIVYRMATLESIQPGVVSEIDRVLAREMQATGAFGASKVGGIESVAEMLNSIDKSSETRILATLEENSPDLVEQIRELMFTFEDIVLVDNRGMQLVLKETPRDELTLALKTASEPVKELIFSAMSQRAGELLRDDLDNMGPVKVSDVERSQQTMVKITRRLEEEGKVVISGRGGSKIV